MTIALIVTPAKGALAMEALNVFLEPNRSRKRDVQERLTAMLSSWFGKADSNAKYSSQAEMLDGYVAEREGVPRGLLLLNKAARSVRKYTRWTSIRHTIV